MFEILIVALLTSWAIVVENPQGGNSRPLIAERPEITFNYARADVELMRVGSKLEIVSK